MSQISEATALRSLGIAAAVLVASFSTGFYVGTTLKAPPTPLPVNTPEPHPLDEGSDSDSDSEDEDTGDLSSLVLKPGDRLKMVRRTRFVVLVMEFSRSRFS